MARSRSAPVLQDAVLFAPVGGNSGLVAMLALALAEQRRLRVIDWHVVLLPGGVDHMEKDTLAQGAALDRLHALDPTLLPRDRMRRVVFADRHGSDPYRPSPAREQRYLSAVLKAAKDAVAAAGERPVVFALVAGRDRVMTVAATLTAQFVARPDDLVVDLRVTPPTAVEDGAYVLPVPRGVGAACRAPAADGPRVRVVDVPLPRLVGLLPPHSTSDFGALLRMGQRAIDAASPVRIDLDLNDARAKDFIAGIPVRFSPSEKLLLAAFAVAQGSANGSMRWPTRPQPPGHPLTEVFAKVPWSADVETEPCLRFRGKTRTLGRKMFDPAKQEGRLEPLVRSYTDLARHLNAKLEKISSEHPELPRINIVSKKIGGADPHARVQLVGMTPLVSWPG